MKIIRWFLSHIFLILLVVTVIYGYMFWGNLAGDDTPAGKALAYLSDEFVEVEEFIAAVKAKQAKLSADTQNREVAPPLAELADAVDETNVAKENVAVTPPQNSTQPLPNRQRQVAANESSFTVAPPLAKPQPAKPQPATVNSVTGQASQDTFITADVEQKLENVDKHGRVVGQSMEKDAVRGSWITARKSFFQRKYDLSEQSYQNVIDNTTDNYDAYGELGNVYFNQGKKQQAASAYFEAASILVRKGQIQRARTLMGLLRQLDSTKASELQTLIDSTVS